MEAAVLSFRPLGRAASSLTLPADRLGHGSQHNASSTPVAIAGVSGAKLYHRRTLFLLSTWMDSRCKFEAELGILEGEKRS